MINSGVIAVAGCYTVHALMKAAAVTEVLEY